MTSEQAMNSRPLCRAALVLGGLVIAGCVQRHPGLVQPHRYDSPYPLPKLWAVAPLDNQTGTLLIDGAHLADKLTQQFQQVDKIEVLPVNRVIEAMAAKKLDRIDTVAQAMGLIEDLNVDGLVVGTVTAWDPYEPPKIGMTIQLYSRQNPDGTASLDTRALVAAATDPAAPMVLRYPQPIDQASAYLDAAHGDVLKRLRQYAAGRSGYESPAGWRQYLLNMDLYSEFVSHEMMRRLFASEWDRLTAATPAGPADQNATRDRQP